jgi:membrane-bound lytic murein transglycosylase A
MLIFIFYSDGICCFALSLSCFSSYFILSFYIVRNSIFPLLLIAVLAGCAGSPPSVLKTNDRAEQYLDGDLPNQLNRVSRIESNTPRDYSEFGVQSKLVLERSRKLANVYKPIYDKLNEWALENGNPAELDQFGIQAAQLGGSDSKGNVLFTGYFSPVIELRHKPTGQFRYPVYKMPKCTPNCPTRAQIYQGALNGRHLELGYAANLIDPFMMEVQGSGFVHFGDDDSMQYLAYAGKNGKSYISIGKVLIDRGEVAKEKMSLKAIKEWVMQHDESTVRQLLEENPSFVFFTPQNTSDVKGSAGIPLVPLASVAGDRSIFPMGTPILAEVPLLNADGTWSGTHQLKLLIVLDTGGAVKDNHLDLYHGIGPRAGIESGHYRHFGRVWKLGLDNSATQSPWALPPLKL